MDLLNQFLQNFIPKSRSVLGDSLEGIYLHGSGAMGCFHEASSDIDLILVVKESLPEQIKLRFLDLLLEMNGLAPAKGIELSLVTKQVCRPFRYPTPFELHFSIQYLDWCRSSPQDYIRRMQGTDKDLAAHFTVLWHRGQCLWGTSIEETFERVDPAFYFDSIWNDVKNAREAILSDPVYLILNLCRVLAYAKEGKILSKAEGGSWGLSHLPVPYHHLTSLAMAAYSFGIPASWPIGSLRPYAQFLLDQIQKEIGPHPFFTQQ